MTVKTASQLKAAFQGQDSQDFINDLVDSAEDLPAASSTVAGVVELATNAEALAAQSITLGITPAALGNVLTGMKFISFDGRSGAGACTLTGAAVGAMVIGVFGITAGALGDASASFESGITVVNQIQQSSASNLSANDYVAVLRSVA